VYPLALLEAAVLVIDAVTTQDVAALARAGLAALIVGAGWFLLAFAAGDGVGLGDMPVSHPHSRAAWVLGWTAMMRARLITVLLVVVTAAVAVPDRTYAAARCRSRSGERWSWPACSCAGFSRRATLLQEG
jgi:hypothetical protein